MHAATTCRELLACTSALPVAAVAGRVGMLLYA